MTDSIIPNEGLEPEPTADAGAKSHFAKAVDEAKAGAKAFRDEAQGRADEYRAKASERKDEWSEQARAKTGEAKEKAYNAAVEGKHRASEAMTSAARMVEDNAAYLDEKVGVKYGDYARSAASSIEGAAVRLEEKSLEEISEDAKEFVREKPALAVGIAVTAGFMLARLFKGR
jgi:ElaB/YqjD/DUF883 family membrane-anchored ribosome-binding protein